MKTEKRRSRRSIFFGCLCALLALFALAPSTAWPGRAVENAPYDDGGYFYTGALHAGKFNGYGTVAFPDGARYEGGFYEGAFQGAGIFRCGDWFFDGIFENGEPIEGVLHAGEKEIDFRANRFELAKHWRYAGVLGAKGQRGRGLFIFADGAKYEGECADGLAQGQGTYTDKDGNRLYTGAWRAGSYEGEGAYTAPDGSFTYKGSFRAGKFEGKGTVTTKEGKIVAGMWKSGWRVAK